MDTSSKDHWRENWRGTDRLAVLAVAVPPGETFIIESVDGSPLGEVEVYAVRDTNDDWITPLTWWGGVLAGVGLLAVILTFVDTRPLQKKGEEWRSRRAGGDASPKQGSRRARRLAGAAVPVAPLDATGVELGDTNAQPLPSSEADAVESATPNKEDER